MLLTKLDKEKKNKNTFYVFIPASYFEFTGNRAFLAPDCMGPKGIRSYFGVAAQMLRFKRHSGVCFFRYIFQSESEPSLVVRKNIKN